MSAWTRGSIGSISAGAESGNVTETGFCRFQGDSNRFFEARVRHSGGPEAANYLNNSDRSVSGSID